MHPSFSTSFRIHRIVVLSSLMIALLGSSVYALTYPGSTPPGEVTGGTYRTYFDNMFFAPCPTGQTIRGFSSSGVPNCIAGAAALSISGALGYTLYHDGTDWVSSPNIYNANGNVGIGTSTGTAKLTVSDDILVRDVNIGRGPGTSFFYGNLRFGKNALFSNGDRDGNIAIGDSALYSNTAGSFNMAIGHNSMYSNTIGGYNTAIGFGSLYSNTTGSNNLALGRSALQGNTSGSNNMALGDNSLRANTTGGYNLAIGSLALGQNTTGSYNTAVGGLAWNTTGVNNTSIGSAALWSNTTGSYNTAVGMDALRNNDIGNWNTALGERAGRLLTTGSGNVFLGGYTATNITDGSRNIVIGYNLTTPQTNISDYLSIGDWIYGNGGNIGIGTNSSLTAKLTVAGQIKITGGSPSTGSVLTSDGAGLATWQPVGGAFWSLSGNTAGTNDFLGTTNARDLSIRTNNTEKFRITASGNLIGLGAFPVLATPQYSLLLSNGTMMGMQGAYQSVIGGYQGGTTMAGNNNSTYGGTYAGQQMAGSTNTAIGGYIAGWLVAGNDNTAVGGDRTGRSSTAMYSLFAGGREAGVSSSGDHQTAIGGRFVGSTMAGSHNTAIGGELTGIASNGSFNFYAGGYSAGRLALGTYNTVLGGQFAGAGLAGSYNVAIGTYAGSGMTTGNHNLYLGTAAIGNAGQSNQFSIGNILYGSGMGTGGLANGQVGIGTMNPTAKLEIAGQIKITGGSPGANKVLVSDATGLASWQGSPASCTPTGTGVNNQCYGINSLQNNTSGNGNTAIGDYSLRDVVTGYENTSIGYYASRFVTSGYENTAIGTFAMASNLGSQNVAIGKNAMGSGDGNMNTAVGYGAMWLGSTGISNISLGALSMGNGMAGNDNIAIGGGAMYWLTALADNNIAIGRNSMYFMGSGANNTAVGYRAMENVGGGSSNNVALGELAGYGVYGYGLNFYNVFLGSRAGMNIGSGSSNVAIGYSAGNTISSGNYNIAIGHGAQVVSGTGSNQLNIGNWIYGSGGNIGIGTSSSLTTRLTVDGQIKITGGSPGLGKVLISDANGVGTWATYVSGSTATGITGGVQNYVSKFGTGGNGLYASQIFDNGTNVAIGTGTATKKLTIDSNLVNDSGLRLSRISSTSTAYTGAAMGLGVDVNGNVIPISNGDVVVYDGIDRASPPTPDPNIAGRQISYDFNNFFDIPTKQSFVVSDGSSASNNGPYFKENGSSAVCSWNGTYGSSAYNCATADPVTGLSASPHNSFTMTAKGTTFGYQIALGARGDAPLFARSGRFNGAQGGGLYTNDSPYQTPAPWQKVLTVPANHPEYLYVNTGLNSQLQTQTGGGNVGIGTTFPNSRFEVWTGATTSPLLHFRGTNNVAMGLGAMNVAVSGNANSAYGAESLFSITTGYSNAAFGYRALRTNAGGYNNVSIGQESLFSNNGGSWNSAVGYQALYSNSSGTGNIAFGPQALYNLTTGNSNIAIGYQAARVIAGSSVSRNIAIGYQSLYSSTASDLIAIGHQALYANSSGVRNTAIGYQSLDSVTSGSGNTAVGYDTLSQTTGSNNTAYGNGAGNGITSGSNNIAIGSNAQVPTATASNQLSIGNWIYGNGGNIGIGTSSSLTAKLTVAGTVKLGTNGSTLNNIIKVANALDVPSVAAGACTAQTTTVTNAAVGGVASVSPASALTDRMIIAYARVSAANTVEIKFCNESAAPIDLASMSYYISVIQ